MLSWSERIKTTILLVLNRFPKILKVPFQGDHSKFHTGLGVTRVLASSWRVPVSLPRYVSMTCASAAAVPPRVSEVGDVVVSGAAGPSCLAPAEPRLSDASGLSIRGHSCARSFNFRRSSGHYLCACSKSHPPDFRPNSRDGKCPMPLAAVHTLNGRGTYSRRENTENV